MGKVNLSVLKEQTPEKAVRFSRSFQRARSEFFNLTDDGVRRMDALVRELQSEVRSRLLFASPDDPTAPFETRIVPEITREINGSLDEFSRIARREINERLETGFESGSTVTINALQTTGLSVAAPKVTPEILVIASRKANDVFTEIVSDLGRRMTRQINLSVTGLQSSSQALRNINNMLKTSKEVRRGLRRRIGFAFQSEAIVRTEVGRIYSNAQQLASEQILDIIPEMKKKWILRPGSNSRKGHRDIAEATREGGSIGPIPTKSRFKVRDFSRTGRTSFLTLGKRIQPRSGTLPGQRVIRTDPFTRRGRVITNFMMFPRDESASAGNVLLCQCTTEEVIPDLDKALNRSLGVIEIQ